MLIYGYIPKSKKRKVTKSVREQNEQWLLSVQKMSTNFSRKTSISSIKAKEPFSSAPKSFHRETPYIASKNPTNMSPCVKKSNNVYTGDKIKGIGTMHKSNAVPVFSDQEAKDISSMRR
jgi:hypothetical protein